MSSSDFFNEYPIPPLQGIMLGLHCYVNSHHNTSFLVLASVKSNLSWTLHFRGLGYKIVFLLKNHVIILEHIFITAYFKCDSQFRR